jgi:hypothetical protein
MSDSDEAAEEIARLVGHASSKVTDRLPALAPALHDHALGVSARNSGRSTRR